MQPLAAWIARPVLIKELEPGRKVGYSMRYTVPERQTIATFPVGYAGERCECSLSCALAFTTHLFCCTRTSLQTASADCSRAGEVCCDASTPTRFAIKFTLV